MLRKWDKISLKKEENGKVLELWFNLSAKTEPLKSSLTRPHQPWSLRNSATTKEIERKSRTSPTRETLLSNKSRKSPKSSKKSQWPRTSPEPSSKSSVPAFPSAALLISKTPRKSLPNSPEVKSKYDLVWILFKLSSTHSILFELPIYPKLLILSSN